MPQRPRPKTAGGQRRRTNETPTRPTRPASARVHRRTPYSQSVNRRLKLLQHEEDVLNKRFDRFALRRNIEGRMKRVRARSASRTRPSLHDAKESNPSSPRSSVATQWEKIKKTKQAKLAFLEKVKQGRIMINVLSCSNLLALDETSGASDPYVGVMVENVGKVVPGDVQYTNVRFKTINPVFNEVVTFRVYSWTGTARVKFSVYDEDGGDKEDNDKLGDAILQIKLPEKSQFKNGQYKSQPQTVFLVGDSPHANYGSLNFSFSYMPDRSPLAETASESFKNASYISPHSALHKLPTRTKEAIGKLVKNKESLELDPQALLPFFAKLFAKDQGKRSNNIWDSEETSFSSNDLGSLLQLVSHHNPEASVDEMVKFLDVNCDEEISLSESLHFFMEDSRQKLHAGTSRSFQITAMNSRKVDVSVYSKVCSIKPLGRHSSIPYGLATASNDGVVRLWSSGLNLEFQLLLCKTKTLFGYRYDADEIRTKKVLATDVAEILSGSNGGKSSIVVGCTDRTLRFFDLPKSFGNVVKLNHVEKLSTKGIPMVIDICCHRNLLFCGDSDGYIDVYNTRQSIKKERTVQAHSHTPIRQLRFVPFLDAIISAGLDGSLIITYIRDWRPSLLIRNGRGIISFDISESTHTMVVVGFDQKVEIIDPLVRSRIGFLGNSAGNHGHRDMIIGVSINDKFNQIITASQDNVLKIWDVRDHRLLQTVTDENQSGSTNCIAVNGQGTLFSCGFNISSWQPSPSTSYGNSGTDACDFDANATGSSSTGIVHKLPSCYQDRSSANITENYCLATSSGHILCCESSGKAALYNAYRRKEIYRFHVSHGNFQLVGIVLHANEKSFFTAAENGTLAQWNLSSGWKIKDCEKSKHEIMRVQSTLTRDNTWCILGMCSSGNVVQWNKYGKIMAVINANHRDDLVSYCKCGDRHFATGSANGTISIWATGTWRVRYKLVVPVFEPNVVNSNVGGIQHTKISDSYFKRPTSIDCLVYIRQSDLILGGTSRGHVVGVSSKTGRFIAGGKSNINSYDGAAITALQHNEVSDEKGKVVSGASILVLGDTNGRVRMFKIALKNTGSNAGNFSEMSLGKPFRCWKDTGLNDTIYSISHVWKLHVFVIPSRCCGCTFYNYLGQKVSCLNLDLRREIVHSESNNRQKKDKSFKNKSHGFRTRNPASNFSILAIDNLKTNGDLIFDI